MSRVEASLVTVAMHDSVALVTLNRPVALNALSLALRAQLCAQLRRIAGDETVDVVVLTGAGRAFCVGLDLKELGGEVEAAPARDAWEVDVADAMAGLAQPVIGAINGYAITGGFEIALMCDLLIGSSEARFADTHARVGVVPGWGLTQRLARLIGTGRAKEMSLSGNYIDAQTALAWGLLNRVTGPDSLIDACLQLARDIADTDAVTRAEIKRLIDAGSNTTLEMGLEMERAANRAHWQESFSADALAARRQRIQQRAREQNG